MTDTLRSIFILTYDTLSIPEAMSVPHMTVKSIVYGFLPIFFVIGAVSNVLQTITGSKDLKGLIKRLILLLVGLMLYDFIFLKVIAFCDVVANAIGEQGRIYGFIDFVVTNSVRETADAGGGPIVRTIAGILATVGQAISPQAWILSLLNIAIIIGQPVLLMIRYALLCFLYIFGPIAYLLSFFSATRKVLSGWFVNLVQISFWIITMRILESVIVSLNVQSLSASWPGQDIIPWVLVMVIYIAFLILTPVITAKVLSGDNLGAVGSLAVGMAAAAVASAATGKGTIGAIIGKPTHTETVNGVEQVVAATGMHAVANRVGTLPRSLRSGIGNISRNLGEKIRGPMKTKPRR